MTQSPPPEPPPQQDSLGFDDFIGIFVAIAGIGTILFWTISHKSQGFNLPSFEPIAASPSATLSATPIPSSAPNAQSSTQVTPALPQDVIPSSPQASVQRRNSAFVPIPVPIASASPIATGFSDVSSHFWAAPFIGLLAQRGILTGFLDGTFRPNAPVTRAEFSTMLEKAFDRPGNLQALQFSDVPLEYWASPAIAKSVQTGFMRGYPEGDFRPEQQIPKVQIFVALASGLNLLNPSDSTQVVSYYQDAAQIPPYGVDRVAAATTNSMVVNYPDPKLLTPNQIATRSDAAALIYQALVKDGKADRISSQYIVQP
jgi:hypothetical protein